MAFFCARILLILTVSGLFFSSAPVLADSRIVIPYVSPEDHRHDYVMSLLQLALNKTVDEYGGFELVHSDVPTEQARSLRMVKDGNGMDLAWSMTSVKREQDLLPIRVPLHKGLLGYRVFIIDPGLQPYFSRVRSLRDLKFFKAGQGHDWPDTIILRRNGLPVVVSPRYHLCFDMLSKQRFDYFPRGLIEPWSELEQYNNLNLAVEKTLLLRYPAPIYFFVNRKNQALANRIYKGLNMALDDGSFDEIFYNHPQVVEAFRKSQLKKRRILDLVNPLLPAETPLDDKRLWIDLEKIP